MTDMTDYQMLLQKFNNFKTFVASVSSNAKVIKDYETMTDSEFLLFGVAFLLPNTGKLDLIVTQMMTKLGITMETDRDKLRRYLECFCEYFAQLNGQDVLQLSIANVVQQNITTKS